MGRGADRRQDEGMPLAEPRTRGAVRIRRMDSRFDLRFILHLLIVS
jgi:hypothetical protein